MNILVLGAGKVGRNIAKNLARQTFDVCIVDVDIERLKSIQEDHDLAIVQGHASSPEVLKKAGANIAATGQYAPARLIFLAHVGIPPVSFLHRPGHGLSVLQAVE